METVSSFYDIGFTLGLVFGILLGGLILPYLISLFNKKEKDR